MINLCNEDRLTKLPVAVLLVNKVLDFLAGHVAFKAYLSNGQGSINHSIKRERSGLRQEDRDMLAQKDRLEFHFFFLALDEFDPLCVMS